MKKVSIIGAGFSGLTLAWELKKLGFDVQVFEKNNRVGGVIHTGFNEFGQFETGANGIMFNSQVEKFFKEINFQPVFTKTEAKKRYIYRDYPRRWPLRLLETVKVLFKLLGIILKGKNSLKPSKEQTIAQWGLSFFGESFLEFLLGPALQGIYAGDPNKMSSSLILGGFFSDQRRDRPRGMVSGQNGIAEILLNLEAHLLSKGVSIHKDTVVKLSSLRENKDSVVVIATSVRQAEKLLADLTSDDQALLLKQSLMQIETAPLISVTAYWSSAPKKYRGFGILFPQKMKMNILGLLMNSYIFPFRDKFHAETYIMGGANNANLINKSDQEILSLILQDRKQTLQEDSVPLHVEITRWAEGLPQYSVSMEKVLPTLKYPAGIYLHGNYLGSIGLTKILAASVELAERIAKEQKVIVQKTIEHEAIEHEANVSQGNKS